MITVRDINNMADNHLYHIYNQVANAMIMIKQKHVNKGREYEIVKSWTYVI